MGVHGNIVKMGTLLKKINSYKTSIMSFLWSSNSPSTEMKEKSDEEPKSKIVTKEAVEASLTNKSELKRAAKRPIESEEEDQKIGTKKSKSAQKRNEIASSLSSSAVKKRQADYLIKSSESDDESQTKKLKEDNSEENESDQQLPLKQNPLKRQLKFESELSPKKMLKNVQHSVQTSSSDIPHENKNNVEEKELISDLKAFKADQERSEERGRRLMQAFDDD